VDLGSPEFVEQFNTALRRQRWFRGLPASLKDDVVQSVIQVLLEKETHRQLPTKIDYIAYAVGVARHKVWRLGRDAAKHAVDDAADVTETPSGAPSPEQITETRELGEYIQRAFQELPIRQRLVIELILEEGYRIADVAQMLGTTPNSVSQNLSRAIKRLRQQMDNR
jgi:RNA polymerase sigma factor (sigma-70 family)